MGAFTSYFLHFASLFILASPNLPLAEKDSIQHEEWLLTDTLDLHLAGPAYEVSFFREGIIFLSSVYEGLSMVPLDQALFSNSKPLFSNDPYPYAPAGLTFSGDQQTCFVTRHAEDPGEFRMEKIFGLSVANGETSGLHQLSFTLDSCRYLHPSLSSNDSVMVFASDRLPTSGGLDLFMTRLSSTGWSTPVNLGPTINSNGHERYPFLDQENNLWFSSTGHSGYGSYDIYVCPFDGLAWEQAQNLGPSINSSMDEMGFSIHPGGQVALFSRRSLTEGMAIRLLNKEAADYSIAMILQNQAEPPADPTSIVPPPSEPETKELADAPNEKAKLSDHEAVTNPQNLVFRVQILSSAKANSTPSVLIEGSTHSTFEYFYKGAYRLCVGEFETVQTANDFRLQCRRAGYNQAFVAAFRGDKRETDPSVFKN
jgi:hypothetical protein